MGENVARKTSKCPICGNEVDLFIFYNDKLVGCKYCGVNIPKRSNADRIRSMTDEELATWIYMNRWNEIESLLEWLKQESEGE